MTKSLQDKIESLDITVPYVWRLRSSEADFNEIETYLKTIVDKEGVTALSKSDNAIMTRGPEGRVERGSFTLTLSQNRA